MNEEAIGVLYELAQGDGYSKTLDEFKALMQSNEDAVNDMYSLAQSDGYTKTIDEFQVLVGFGGQVEKKNPNDTLPSDSVTETTDSTIVTEENDGVSDSLSEEITYLDDELQELVDTAEIVTIPRAGVSVTTFPKDGLKTRILSDPNIKAALDGGTLSIEDIDAAIAGDADIIKQLQKTSVKGSQVYQDEIDERNLNAKYNYLDQSNLIDKSPSQETIDADANQISLIIDKVNAFQEKYGDEITQRIDNIENEPDFTVEKFVAEKRLTDQSVPTEEEFTIASENMSYLSGEKTPVDYDTGYEGEDIDSMYDVSRLKQVNGFTAEAIKDFDGYLNAQGYKEDYKRLLAGETISEDGRYYDFSGNYNPTLAAERLKAQYLTNYINNQIERNVDSQILNYKLKNNGRHPVADGVQINFDSGVDDIALSKYIEEEFPTLTANLKAQDVKNEENYQSYLDGDNPWFRQMFKQGWRSVADRINSFSAGVYDFIGLDSAADEIRMRDAQNDLERDDFMRYTYTDGDKAIVNGREYGVDKRGQVYDLEIKKRVTNVLTPVQLQDIRQTVQNEGTPFYSFSAAGAAVQTSGIAADLVLQIGLTRGVGNLGKIASVGGSMFGKTKKVVDILKKVPMKGTTSSAMIAQGMLFSTNLGEDAYKRAINAGISIKDAERIQQIAASQGFVLGSLTAPISTQTIHSFFSAAPSICKLLFISLSLSFPISPSPLPHTQV